MESRRRRLSDYVESGQLRDDLTKRSNEDDMVDLIIEICRRYCEPRKPAAWRRFAQQMKKQGGSRP